MNQPSIADMELQRRAFGHYLNYLVNHKAKGVITIGNPGIPITTEIKVVGDKINDLKRRLATEKARTEA